MTARQNPDGTVAVMVENYLVASNAGYTYTTLNLDAAVARDVRWHIATNAIEFSPGPGGGASFVKFFTFDAATGARSLTADMDGRGPKAMPGPCVTCHGGRAGPLTPPDATGRQLFPVVRNTTTTRGYSRAHASARSRQLRLPGVGPLYPGQPGSESQDPQPHRAVHLPR